MTEAQLKKYAGEGMLILIEHADKLMNEELQAVNQPEDTKRVYIQVIDTYKKLLTRVIKQNTGI